MSVYKSKRSTSAIQYVENARQLQVFTIKNCVKFPKRYTYIVVQKIANLVEDIDTHVRVAESMMPTNLHEAQLMARSFCCALRTCSPLSVTLTFV